MRQLSARGQVKWSEVKWKVSWFVSNVHDGAQYFVLSLINSAPLRTRNVSVYLARWRKLRVILHRMPCIPFLTRMVLFLPGPDFEPSEILHNQTEYWELLKGWLGRVSTLPSKWKLCYRATDNGWSSSTFHSQCNGLGPTVTFIRVGEYIFGGYTDRNWRKYKWYALTSRY